MFGWCLRSSDEDVVPKFLACPFWRSERCLGAVLLSGVGSGVGWASGVVIWMSVGIVVVPGGVVPCPCVVVVVVVVVDDDDVHFRRCKV